MYIEKLIMGKIISEIMQRIMIRLIGVFQKNGIKSEYVTNEGASYFVVMADENNGM